MTEVKNKCSWCGYNPDSFSHGCGDISSYGKRARPEPDNRTNNRYQESYRRPWILTDDWLFGSAPSVSCWPRSVERYCMDACKSRGPSLELFPCVMAYTIFHLGTHKQDNQIRRDFQLCKLSVKYHKLWTEIKKDLTLEDLSSQPEQQAPPVGALYFEFSLMDFDFRGNHYPEMRSWWYDTPHWINPNDWSSSIAHMYIGAA